MAALVPRPRPHLIRFHGVLAPNAKMRAKVVPLVFDASGQGANTGGLVSGSSILNFTTTSSWVTVKVNAPTKIPLGTKP